MQTHKTPLPVRLSSPVRHEYLVDPSISNQDKQLVKVSDGSRVVYSPPQRLASSPSQRSESSPQCTRNLPKVSSISSTQEDHSVKIASVPDTEAIKSKAKHSSPRGAVPKEGLTPEGLSEYVNKIISSPVSRQPIILSPTRTETRKDSKRPSAVISTSSQRQVPDYGNRRQGPVVVTMNTSITDNNALASTGSIPKQLQSDNMIVNTPYGQFVIPNYDLMSVRDRMIAMHSYETKFKQINEDWKHTGDIFEGPKPGEDIVTVAVRYLETEKYLSTRTGSDFWFIILCALWAFIEYNAKRFKLPADGYTESQIGMYKMYQSQLIRMGTVSNVGAEWPPWLQVCVTSGFSLAILVLMSKFGVGGHSGKVMKEISSMISGHKNVEYSEAGTPKPSEGGIIDMVKGMASGGNIGTVMSLFTSMMGVGGDEKKKKKKKKNKKKDNKEAEEAADIDI